VVSFNSAYQPSVMELAREGDLRAIAYWINSFLMPQGIYVRVGVTRSGSLHLLVEFERQPDRETLIRFICHRLCRLKSEVIDIVRIAARPLGSKQIVWSHSVRLLVPIRRGPRSRSAAPGRSPQPRSTPTPIPTPVKAVARPDRDGNVSSIIHQPKAHQPNTQRAKAQPPKTHHAGVHPRKAEQPKAPVRQSVRRPPTAAQLQIRRRRSIVLGGTAVAAFVIGCGFEAMNRDTPPATTAQSSPDSAIASNRSNRSNTVTTAVDPVTVTQQLAVDPTDPTVTLTFASESVLGDPDPAAQGVSWNLTGIQDYRQADVALTTLDNALTAANPVSQSNTLSQTGSIDFNPLQALTAGSIDVVNLASNELMQTGQTGLVQTLDTLEQAGIHSIGAGRDQRTARRPEILDVKGQRIAYLGYSDSDLHTATSRSAGMNTAVNDQVAADIRAIRPQVDWIVVNYHWSQDLAAYPGDWQMSMARFAVDQGADLVVGHHPNVLQGAEIYKGRAIAYSLGNFIFADSQDSSETDYDTAVLKVSIRDRQMRLEFLPVQVQQSQPEIVQGEKAEQILQYIQQASGLFEQPMQSPTVLDVRSPAGTAEPQPPASPSFSDPAAPSRSSDSFTPSETAPNPSNEGFTVPSEPAPFTPDDTWSEPSEPDSESFDRQPTDRQPFDRQPSDDNSFDLPSGDRSDSFTAPPDAAPAQPDDSFTNYPEPSYPDSPSRETREISDEDLQHSEDDLEAQDSFQQVETAPDIDQSTDQEDFWQDDSTTTIPADPLIQESVAIEPEAIATPDQDQHSEFSARAEIKPAAVEAKPIPATIPSVTAPSVTAPSAAVPSATPQTNAPALNSLPPTMPLNY
jgi:poly-gamma-glutamate capsule biosynthesis protein CapA/YwtB (metallophosphatase superfamily)